MKYNFFCFLVTLFLLSISVFSQTESKHKTPETVPPVTSYPVIYSPILLPESANSWTINIYKEGGILGVSNFTIALNSDGKFQCGNKGKVKSFSLDNKAYSELNDLLKNFEQSFYSKSIDNSITYCNDCFYNTLSFYRRSRSEKPAENENSSKTILPDAKAIYQKVLAITDCGNDFK